jgi:hypothetical protein
MVELLVAVGLIISGVYMSYVLIMSSQRYSQQVILHGIHVQDDCWRRANDRAQIDAKIIERLDASNAELVRQVSELNAAKLNFAVMQDHLLENVRRTIIKEIRPESETHVEAAPGNEETKRITREELRLVGAASCSGGNGR